MGTRITTIPNNGQQTVRRQFGVRLAEPLFFRTPDDGPFPLILASGDPRVNSLKGHLRNYDKQVLEGTGTKYSIVLDIMNQKKFAKQKYSHLRNAARDLGGVARQIAEVVQEYIEETQHDMPTKNDRWRLGPNHIKFEDLYLVELRQVSKASFLVFLACDESNLPPVQAVDPGSQA